MSDLHNLSAPVENSFSDKPPIKKPAVKADFKKLQVFLEELRLKFGKKLIISLGISFSVVSLIVVILNITRPRVAQAPQVIDNNEVTSETTTAKVVDGVKFTRFDGNQYSFYFPNSYSFLDRSNHSTLNEVTFSNKDNSDSFLLREFIYYDVTPENLETIYDEIRPTINQPSSITEITLGGNVFEKTTFSGCEAIDNAPVSPECVLEDQYIYTIEINGLLVAFINLDLDQIEFEETILNTFTKNLINPDSLGETYVISNIPRIKTRIDAHILLGIPRSVNLPDQCEGCMLELIYQLKDSMEVVLIFDEKDNLIDTKGRYAKFEFDLSAVLKNPSTVVSAQKAHEIIVNDRFVRRDVLSKNPDATIYLDEDPEDPEYWLITIFNDKTSGIKLGEYRISKSTGKFKKAEVETETSPAPANP